MKNMTTYLSNTKKTLGVWQSKLPMLKRL